MTPTYLAAVAARHGLDPEKFAEAVKQIQREQEADAYRITDGEGDYDYRTEEPDDFGVKWAARYGRKHEPLFTFPPAAQVPPDWVMVPKVPTDEMRDAGNEIIKDRIRLFQAWHSMLRSAPEYKEPAKNKDYCPDCGHHWKDHDFGVPRPMCPTAPEYKEEE